MRDTVSSHVGQVLQVYETHADAIGIDAVLQASVVSPSVAEMLEWLQDIERHYRSSYPLRKCQTVSVQSCSRKSFRFGLHRITKLCSMGQLSLASELGFFLQLFLNSFIERLLPARHCCSGWETGNKKGKHTERQVVVSAADKNKAEGVRGEGGVVILNRPH